LKPTPQILTGYFAKTEKCWLNDTNGQPVRVPLTEVAERHQSTPPMPSNMIEQMPGATTICYWHIAELRANSVRQFLSKCEIQQNSVDFR
jgi:hypothetical protein